MISGRTEKQYGAASPIFPLSWTLVTQKSAIQRFFGIIMGEEWLFQEVIATFMPYSAIDTIENPIHHMKLDGTARHEYCQQTH